MAEDNTKRLFYRGPHTISINDNMNNDDIVLKWSVQINNSTQQFNT